MNNNIKRDKPQECYPVYIDIESLVWGHNNRAKTHVTVTRKPMTLGQSNILKSFKANLKLSFYSYIFNDNITTNVSGFCRGEVNKISGKNSQEFLCFRSSAEMVPRDATLSSEVAVVSAVVSLPCAHGMAVFCEVMVRWYKVKVEPVYQQTTSSR